MSTDADRRQRPEPSETAVRAHYAVFYPNTSWNPYQDSLSIELHRQALRTAYAIDFGAIDLRGVPPQEEPTDEQVTMPVAVAERLYRAILDLPADLTTELCDATEDFYRCVRLRGPAVRPPYEFAQQEYEAYREAVRRGKSPE